MTVGVVVVVVVRWSGAAAAAATATSSAGFCWWVRAGVHRSVKAQYYISIVLLTCWNIYTTESEMLMLMSKAATVMPKAAYTQLVVCLYAVQMAIYESRMSKPSFWMRTTSSSTAYFRLTNSNTTRPAAVLGTCPIVVLQNDLYRYLRQPPTLDA